MKLVILTLFPQEMAAFFNKGLLGKALKKGLFSLDFVNVRDFGIGRHQAVDDTPFGGRLGMLGRVDVWDAAIRSVNNYTSFQKIFFSPKGRLLKQKQFSDWVEAKKNLMLICGYYEGVDARLMDLHDISCVSLGDFVLTSGELPALVVADACCRLIPGVLGNQESHEEESFTTSLLEHEQYTKPRSFSGVEIPPVLVSGHHEKIKDWKFTSSLRYTLFSRPDLVAKSSLNQDAQQTIKSIIKESSYE